MKNKSTNLSKEAYTIMAQKYVQDIRKNVKAKTAETGSKNEENTQTSIADFMKQNNLEMCQMLIEFIQENYRQAMSNALMADLKRKQK